MKSSIHLPKINAFHLNATRCLLFLQINQYFIYRRIDSMWPFDHHIMSSSYISYKITWTQSVINLLPFSVAANNEVEFLFCNMIITNQAPDNCCQFQEFDICDWQLNRNVLLSPWQQSEFWVGYLTPVPTQAAMTDSFNRDVHFTSWKQSFFVSTAADDWHFRTEMYISPIAVLFLFFFFKSLINMHKNCVFLFNL